MGSVGYGYGIGVVSPVLAELQLAQILLFSKRNSRVTELHPLQCQENK